MTFQIVFKNLEFSEKKYIAEDLKNHFMHKFLQFGVKSLLKLYVKDCLMDTLTFAVSH